MKSMTRILGATAVLAVIAMVAVPTASANCVPNKSLGSWGPAGGYFYVNLPPGNDNSTVVGRFWQTGQRALANEGTFDDSQWLKLCPASSCGTDKWYILGELGTAGVVGCPAGNLTLTIDTASGHNLSISISETPGWFDLSRFGTDFTFGTKPRVGVQSSSRTGSTVTLNLNLTAQTAGTYTLDSAVAVNVQYRLMTGTGPTDPGPNPALYLVGPILTPGSPTPTNVDCTDGLSKWVATQSIVDGVPADFVGPRTQVSCSPAIADPKFKHVDRPARPNPRSER